MINSSEFHPDLFFARRAYAVPFITEAIALRRGGPNAETHAEKMANALLDDPRVGAFLKVCPQRSGLKFVETERMLAYHCSLFVEFGRNIFSLTPSAQALLDKTDLTAVRMGDFKLPFKSLYLGFGSPIANGAGFKNDHLVDGCYISENAGGLSFLWTIKLNRTTKVLDEWDSLAFAQLDTEDRDRTVLEAFDIWLATIATSEDSAAVKRLLSIAVNALCLISSNAQGLCFTSKDAPDHLARNLTSARPALRDSAKAQLVKIGYSLIRVVDAIGSQKTSHNASGETTDVAAHWRRGHWRRQQHGLKRGLTKLIWIKPTLVRADKGTPEHGHIYTVGA